MDTLLELFEQKGLSEEFDHRFCQALTEVFNAELASIMEYNPASQTLCFRYSDDEISVSDYDLNRFCKKGLVSRKRGKEVM